MQQLQAMQQAQQKTQPILDEINREVGSLSLDEQKVLAQMPEYQMAKQTYEAGFMSFLGTKFSQAVITYVVKNMEDKYGKYLDIFTDVHGNINLELLANAVKAEMKEKSADGFVVNILNKPVRFGEDDVNQLVEIFKTFKQNN